jgi:thioredoxin-like negative regulator of GroEL
MIFLILFQLISANYVELTADNVDSYIGSIPILVKFYSPNCPHCKMMAEDFAEASTAFTNVTFAGVDCQAHNSVCEKYNVSGYPTIYLFTPKNSTGIKFEGTRSVDGFCDFIENYTEFKGKRPPRVFLDVHPLNIEKLAEEHQCLLVVFYAPWCSHSKRFLPQGKLAAASFLPEPNVSIGTVNCGQYQELCENHNITGFPTIKLFKDGNISDFAGSRTADGVINYMNTNCGTQRGIGGLLNDEAGLVAEAQPIAEAFLKAEDKNVELAKMKAVKGAEFYVKVMERYLSGGEAMLEKDLAKMQEILTARKTSWNALDGMKKRFNIFRQFIIKKEQPPIPAEEQGNTEAKTGL